MNTVCVPVFRWRGTPVEVCLRGGLAVATRGLVCLSRPCPSPRPPLSGRWCASYGRIGSWRVGVPVGPPEVGVRLP